jgi:elongation factor Ts
MNVNLNGTTVGDAIQEQMGKIGEKLEVSDYGVVSSECVVAYNHPGNKTAAVVGISKANPELARDLAMQIAAMSPVAVDEDGVSEDLKQKELEIGKEQAINEGKPAEMAEKIALGKLKKFFKEKTLLNQEFIKDNKKSVKDYIKSVDSELKVDGFKLISLS